MKPKYKILTVSSQEGVALSKKNRLYGSIQLRISDFIII
jgi:hypothetical protein